MASMRVHELAKEFGMDSKEFLDRLHEMKIPAKSHSSTLVDAYVDRIRKRLAPEMAERTALAEAQKAQEEAQRVAAEQEARAAEEAAHREAVERERALREQEKALREEARSQEAEPTKQAYKGRKDVAEAEAVIGKPEKGKKEEQKPAGLSSLLSQIESEKARLEAEKQAARAKKEAATQKATAQKTAAEKVKVEQTVIPTTPGETTGAETAAEEPRKSGKPAKAPATKRIIAAEEEGEQSGERGGKAKGRGKGVREHTDVRVPESFGLEVDESDDDRYRQMAIQAEQLQRDRVLADARAAVEAASGEGEGRRRKRKEKRVAEAKQKAELHAIEQGIDPDLVLDESVAQITTGVTVAEFAEVMKVPSKDIIKRLFLLGTPLTVTQTMNDELVELIADDMDRKVRIVSPEEEYAVSYHDSPEDLKLRPPVVTVMGHVDHGKTSLLDAIRFTGVVATEAGGITQHIGASVAEINGKPITFIDTPGHEAFTAMRARGAKVTDVVVLVVAADDGVMPQTVEAIHHAKAAGVPIVVAVNKIDKPSATPERVRQELTEHGIIPEEWGGQNMFVDVSAKQRIGIDDLLETIILQSDVLELKANPSTLSSGFVIE
ncbi:MAG: GTP-binding protein, partial [Coriobacteriaceae bacterium]|nr:GTP-binding protein [Coriobacteriaceae bacterium]